MSVFGVFSPPPKKAEALVSLGACIGAKVVAWAKGLGTTAGQIATSIMTVDPSGTGASEEAAAGTDWVQCFLRGLAITIAKTLLHTFTQSIVNWINRGFEGQPSFITDLGGFLTDTADQAFGNALSQISPMLCAPFRLDIRAALGLQMSLGAREQIRCRLSDVFANVQGSYQQFVNGTFSGAGGWNSWINIAGTPQNNPYNAFLTTQDYIGLRIVSATGKEVKLLDFGQGFKSWRPCKVPGDDIIVRAPEGGITGTRKGPCKEYGPIQTPGSVIVSQANATLKTTLDDLEVAQDIDAIVGALINQLLVKVMTGIGGLAGASSSGITDRGSSATGSLSTDPTKVLAASSVRPPDGIDCSKRYYPPVIATLTGVRPDDNVNIVYTDKFIYTDRLGPDGKTKVVGTDGKVVQDAQVAVVQGQVLTVPAKDASGKVIQKQSWNPVTGGQTWAEYFDQVQAGCSNSVANLLDTETNKAKSEANAELTVVTGGTPTQPDTPDRNLAVQKDATQSADFVYVSSKGIPYTYSAFFAVNGDEGGGFDNNRQAAIAVPAQGSDAAWWQVDLGKSQKINKIRIFKSYTDSPTVSFSSALKIQVLDDSRAGRVTTYQITKPITDSTQMPLIIDGIGKIGRYVRLEAKEGELHLAEVEVFGTDAKDMGPAPDQPFAVVFTPSTVTLPNARAGDTIGQGNSLSVNATKAGPPVSLRLSLYQKFDDGKTGLDDTQPFLAQPTSFNNHFTDISVSYAQNGNSVTLPVLIPAGSDRCDSAFPCALPGLVVTCDRAHPTACDPENTFTFAKDITLTPDRFVSISIQGTLASSLTSNTYKFVIEAVDANGHVFMQDGKPVQGAFSVKVQVP